MSLTDERLAPGYREAIERARRLIPTAIRDRLHNHFLTGISPNYVGLHDHTVVGEWTFSELAHASASHPTNYWHPVVVLPRPLFEMQRIYWKDQPGIPETIVHELGHILDYGLPWRPEVRPVSKYAHTNRREAFAEAFESWVMRREEAWEMAPEAVAFFTELGGVRLMPKENR